MSETQFLNDNEINAVVERIRHDPGARRDLAGYLHHAEAIDRFSRRDPGPDESERYLEDFRVKYRLTPYTNS